MLPPNSSSGAAGAIQLINTLIPKHLQGTPQLSPSGQTLFGDKCMNRTELGDRACMLRHFNFSTGGGINLKWSAKIATLLWATAITMACGFGARGADVNKELNPKKADLQKYSFDHPAKLRWIFDEDPRSLKIELGPKHYIAKIAPTERFYATTDILARQIPGSIKARVITGPLCQLKEGDVAEMRFDLPMILRA
jgi:hypothetical protein